MANLRLKVPPLVQAGICILAMWLLSRHVPLFSLEMVHRPAIAVLFVTIGGLLALAGIIPFRKAQTTVDPRTPGEATKLVIAGIYNYSRNPMYLGLLLVLLGVAILFGAASSFLIIPLFVGFMNRLQIEPEEEALEKLFAESYKIYKIKVRRWL